MSNKNCLVYETLGSVTDMKIVESASDNCVRLSGVFGVCGIKNGNNRIYNKDNYGKMVENLQNVIVNEGCLGELEHPNTMNINLENVSHKIESIEMNEDGTITGTIRLLDTPKGKIAKAIVEGGCPLFISSRGAGSIDEAGNVTLSTIKTYDLVGTPGFSQAKLNLKENQTLESLNENLAIVFESDDLLGGDSDDDTKKSEDTSSEDTSSEDEPKDDKDNKEDKKDEKPSEDSDESNDEKDNKDNTDKVTMEEIKKAIDTLTDKVTSLEAELHVAKESLEANKVDYSLIQGWVTEEFAPEFKEEIEESMNSISEEVKTQITESVEAAIEENTNAIAEGVQNWVVKEFSDKVQGWVVEEFGQKVQEWITEEYSAEVQNWITEEFAPVVNDWITEEFGATIEGWINEEFAPAHKETILKEAYENVNTFMEAKKTEKLDFIDKMLESIDSESTGNALEAIVKEQEEQNKFKGVYVVENMPAQYKPVWNGLSESKQNEIIRSSRMYDFTKEGVLESFWNNANLTETVVVEKQDTSIVENYQNNVAAQMKRYGKWNNV